MVRARLQRHLATTGGGLPVRFDLLFDGVGECWERQARTKISCISVAGGVDWSGCERTHTDGFRGEGPVFQYSRGGQRRS